MESFTTSVLSPLRMSLPLSTPKLPNPSSSKLTTLSLRVRSPYTKPRMLIFGMPAKGIALKSMSLVTSQIVIVPPLSVSINTASVPKRNCVALVLPIVVITSISKAIIGVDITNAALVKPLCQKVTLFSA